MCTSFINTRAHLFCYPISTGHVFLAGKAAGMWDSTFITRSGVQSLYPHDRGLR